MIALGNSDIKTNNKKRILNLLFKEREITKLDISRKLDISIPTVTTVVGELKDEGIVEEAGMVSSKGGRKPVIIKFLPDSRYSIGIDLVKDHVRAILTNLDSKIIEERTEELSEGTENEVLALIKTLIEDLISSETTVASNLLGIGFSLPGIVNEKELKLEVATNFKLKSISFKEISHYFDMPIYFENEANAAAIAESRLGSTKNLNNLIYVSVNEGIGAGIFINNEMYKGKDSRAGEIGHMCIIKNGRQCNCGRRGCWETYASINALMDTYKEKTNKSKSTDQIMNGYIQGKQYYVQVVDEYIDNLAEGIQNLMFIFNPDYVVIGGQISKYRDILKNKLIGKIFNNNAFYKEGDISILFSFLGNESSIIGASLIPILNGLDL